MEQRIDCFSLLSLLLFLSFSSLCECRSPKHLKNLRGKDGFKVVKHLDYSFPPSEDALLGPSSSPQTFSPYCVYPSPLPITPILPIVSPPLPPTTTIPPFVTPNPLRMLPKPAQVQPNHTRL
ncbi:hypothetical protein KSP40_PGU008289 [Platanthera guangdongensis]|uniref:Uncharacterized protein n=1 Tax=Platanthera guangdongensis TaxID=2320717 RepID=A0ABR2MCP1_9ASPA